MDIVVCIKRVPMTQEVDLKVNQEKKDVLRDNLAYVINDWDNYVIEEAVQLKDHQGGLVTAITVGHEEDEEVLRRALAMGADKAVRIDPGPLQLDPYVVSNLLAAVIRNQPHDLVLTGVQSEDENHGAVGAMLAELLGLRHASVVNRIQSEGNRMTVGVELEGGVDEVSVVELPALMSIQTGINEPRYVSIMGIRKARKKELAVIPAADLGLDSGELTPQTEVVELYLPPETAGAEMIEGDASSVAEAIISIIKERGVNL